MAGIIKYLKRIKPVYTRSPLMLKLIVLAAIVLSTLALTSLRIGINQYRIYTDALRVQAAQVQQMNNELTDNINNKNTVQDIKRIATDELGYVDSNAVFYSDASNQD